MSANRLRRVPSLIWLLVGLIAGDLYALHHFFSFPPASCAALVASSFALWRTSSAARPVALLAAAFVVGAFRAQQVYRPALPANHVAHLAHGEPVYVEGRVQRSSVGQPRRAALVLAAERVRRHGEWIPASGLIRVRIHEVSHTWAPGQPVRAFLKLRRPRNFGNPGEFHYEAYLAREKIYVTAFLSSDQALERTAPFPPHAWSALDRWRTAIARLFSSGRDPDTAAILTALILGDQGGITPELRQAFSRAGVSHVLSISGLHVGLVGGTSFVIFRWLLSRSEWLLLRTSVPTLAMLVSLAPVGVYALLAGGQIPVRRSVCMLAAVACALATRRLTNPYVVLTAAAFLILLTLPGAAADISFQLSFVAVAVLIAASNRFQQWWPPQPPKPRSIYRTQGERIVRSFAAAGFLALCAGLGTAPWTLWHFQQASLISPAANLLVVPVLGSAAVVLGLASAFSLPVSESLAAIFAVLAQYSVAAGWRLTAWFAALPLAALRLPTPTLVELAASAVALAAFLARPTHLRRKARYVALGLLLTAAVNRVVARWPGQALEFQFLSVGQADATLVVFPSGRRWLVDAGGIPGTFDTGERVIGPVLFGFGYHRLDALVLTHPQFDHYGAMPFLADAFAPHWFFSNGQTSDAVSYSALERRLGTRGTRRRSLWAGCYLADSGVRVTVLWPAPNSPERNPNDHSLVLLFEYAGRNVLLPGDMERQVELQLVSRYGPALQADVVKAPHHGSRTSSTAELINATNPKLVIFSVGHQNRFRLPHRSVIAAYARSGSRILRTDWDGMITVRIEASGRLRWRAQRSPWNRWQMETASPGDRASRGQGRSASGSFVDWNCPQR